MELFDNTNSSPDPEDRNPSDNKIKDNIKRLYQANETMRQMDIDVNVKDGVATLEGVVHSAQSWETAQDLAADVQGVRSVRNKIRVEPGPSSTA